MPGVCNLNSVFFPSENIGYIAGGSYIPSKTDNFRIFKTTDNGVTWNIVDIGYSNYLNSIFFTDILHGCSVGNNGAIFNTTDGGNTWCHLYLPQYGILNSVHFPDANTGYIVGNSGIILKTTNGGVGFTTKSFVNNDFTLYPNPAGDKITIYLKNPDPAGAELHIYDQQGRQLFMQRLLGKETELNISQLPAGVYLAELILPNGSLAKEKFVKITNF
jgi:hypothetical protein